MLTPAELAAANVGAVYAIAAELRKRLGGSDFDDLVGDGMVGLMQAAQRFDRARFCGAFSTYARPRIVGSMVDAYRHRYYVGHHGQGGFRHEVDLDKPGLTLPSTPSAEDEALALIELGSRVASIQWKRQFRHPQRKGWCRQGHEVTGANAASNGHGGFTCRQCVNQRRRVA